MSAMITHVLGARPNFVKAAPVIRALAALGHSQRVVHTGQHYDERMSDVFFVQLGLPRPDVNLGVGSGSQAAQRWRQCPPGERHRAHRVFGHVSQHHGCGEHDRSRRRRYSHAGRYYC